LDPNPNQAQLKEGEQLLTREQSQSKKDYITKKVVFSFD
jgi:hypothetical protein